MAKISWEERREIQRKRYAEIMLKNLTRDCEVPKRYLQAEKEHFPNRDIHSLIGKSVFITGSKGTGKTHLAVALLKETIRNTKVEMAEFCNVADLLAEIKSTFNQETAHCTEIDIIHDLKKFDVVILDDLGAENSTPYTLQTLYTIINGRYNNMKTTIITSNLSLDELSDHVGDRIASRVAGMCDELVDFG